MTTEIGNLTDYIRIDGEQLDQKREEYNSISSRLEEFLYNRSNSSEERPAIIRTRNILEEQLQTVRKKLQSENDAENPPDINIIQKYIVKLIKQMKKFNEIIDSLQSISTKRRNKRAISDDRSVSSPIFFQIH